MPSERPLSGTTNKDQPLGFHLCCHPPCQDCYCKSSNTRDTGRTCATLSSTQPTLSLPKPTFDCSRHDFLHLCQFHGNLYEDMSHGTDQKMKFRAPPKKYVHNHLDSTLD